MANSSSNRNKRKKARKKLERLKRALAPFDHIIERLMRSKGSGFSMGSTVKPIEVKIVFEEKKKDV